MNNTKKNIIYSLVLLAAMGGTYVYRNWNTFFEVPKIHVSGLTMGKITYDVKYLDEQKRDFSVPIDSLLKAFNQSLSTYIPDSEISRFNAGSDTLRFESAFFYPVLASSQAVFEASNGAFDPTVMPLVNLWGFGPDKHTTADSAKVDSIKAFVSFSQIGFNRNAVWKADKRAALDFSAIAKGYGVDVVGLYLESQGVNDYMVLIGGEARCKGTNGTEKGWLMGIDNPKLGEAGQEEDGIAYFLLEGQSVATSGNYRNFYMKEGKKYAHTIDPKSGYPKLSDLLSATVFAPDCMTADAYATALMVVGLEEGKKLLEKTGLEGVLVYEKDGKLQVYRTPKAEKMNVEL